MTEVRPPACFMHVPKTAGISLRTALAAALPPDSLAPQVHEAGSLGGFEDFDLLGPQARRAVAATPAEIDGLGRYPAIFGHFSLSTLLRHAPLERIATVLREPRARIVSHYLFLRFYASLRTYYGGAGLHECAEVPFRQFLLDPSAAYAIDNVVCRMLLRGDPRIPPADFIDEADLEALAEEAWRLLSRFGFVGFIEEPEAVWRGVGDHFGVALAPVRENVTGEWEIAAGAEPVPPIGGAETLELLERRCAADAILYRRVVAAARGDSAVRRIEGVAFDAALKALRGFSGAAPVLGGPAGEAAVADAQSSGRWRFIERLRRRRPPAV